MLRARLLSFALGFSVAGAGISQLIWRDLWVDRHGLASEMHQKFEALEARVSSIESLPLSESEPAQVG